MEHRDNTGHTDWTKFEYQCGYGSCQRLFEHKMTKNRHEYYHKQHKAKLQNKMLDMSSDATKMRVRDLEEKNKELENDNQDLRNQLKELKQLVTDRDEKILELETQLKGMEGQANGDILDVDVNAFLIC